MARRGGSVLSQVLPHSPSETEIHSGSPSVKTIYQVFVLRLLSIRQTIS
jgi:hypothetical protein